MKATIYAAIGMFALGVVAALGLRELIMLGVIDVARIMDLEAVKHQDAQIVGSAAGVALLTVVPFKRQLMEQHHGLFILPNLAACCGYGLVWPLLDIWSMGIYATLITTEFFSIVFGFIIASSFEAPDVPSKTRE